MLRNTDAMPQSGTCDSSKYRCDPPTGYVRPFKKLSCFRLLRGRLCGVCDTPLRPGMCDPSKNGSVFVLFGAACEAYSIRPYGRICAILQNTDAIPQPGTCGPSKNCPVFATVGGVWWGVCNTSLRLGMCGPSKNHPVFVPFGAACGAYAIRPYNRVCAILRNTDAIPQPGTCEGSKNGSVFVSFGAVCGAYSIRPYAWVRTTLRNTDAISRPGTRGPSKNCLVFVPFGAVGWGVFNTPLQPGTCEGSKNGSVFATVGGVCGAYAIRPYGWLRVTLRNTDTIS